MSTTDIIVYLRDVLLGGDSTADNDGFQADTTLADENPTEGRFRVFLRGDT